VLRPFESDKNYGYRGKVSVASFYCSNHFQELMEHLYIRLHGYSKLKLRTAGGLVLYQGSQSMSVGQGIRQVRSMSLEGSQYFLAGIAAFLAKGIVDPQSVTAGINPATAF
jgi:hypothetical protein